MSMSPLSSRLSWFLFTVKYTYDLLALPKGERCSVTFSLRLVFFAAKSSSLRAAGLGAFSINRGSKLIVYCLWKAFRSMCDRVFPNSCFSYCLQSFSPSVFQHIFPEGVWPLLTYIHSAFSVSGWL